EQMIPSADHSRRAASRRSKRSTSPARAHGYRHRCASPDKHSASLLNLSAVRCHSSSFILTRTLDCSLIQQLGYTIDARCPRMLEGELPQSLNVICIARESARPVERRRELIGVGGEFDFGKASAFQ